MLTSRPVSDFEKCWCLIFVVQYKSHGCMSSWTYHVLRFNSVLRQYDTSVPMRDELQQYARRAGLFYMQQLPDVRKGCVQRNFTQIEFYVSRNCPQFRLFNFLSHVQEKLETCASKRTIKRLRQVPVQKRI